MTEKRAAPDRVHVLIAEDEADVRVLLQRELRDRGFEVTAVSDGEQAQQILARETFTLVITDIRMPGMDGVELTRLIKQQTPDTEVIIITGFASVESAAEAVRLGAADYLTKPLGDLDNIHSSVDRALEAHDQRQLARHRMLTLEALRDGLASLLDRLPLGIVLLDARGRILQVNHIGRILLDEQQGLSMREGEELVQGRTRDLSRLRELIGGAAGGLEEPGRRVGGVSTLSRREERADLSCWVTPVNIDGKQRIEEEPAAAVFIGDPERRVVTTEELLCRLYPLTPTEGRLAAILMQGKSVDQVANEMQISTNTARTHLKRVFSKTNTSRQGELISLLLSGPALLRLDQDL